MKLLLGGTEEVKQTVRNEDRADGDEEPIEHHEFAEDQENTCHNGQNRNEDREEVASLECGKEIDQTLECEKCAKDDKNDLQKLPTSVNDDRADDDVDNAVHDIAADQLNDTACDEERADDRQKPVEKRCSENNEKDADNDVKKSVMCPLSSRQRKKQKENVN